MREKIRIAAAIVAPFKRMESNPRSKWVDVIRVEINKIMGALHTTYIDVLNLNLPEVSYTRERFSVFMDI